MEIINSTHDFNKIKEEYQQKGIVSINNFLNDEVAESVYSGLKDITEKGLWYQANHGSPKYFQKELRGEESDSAHFSFRYEMFPLKKYKITEMIYNNITRRDIKKLEKIADNPEMELHYSHPLREISDFLDSPQITDLVSSITETPLSSDQSLSFASRYTADDFLAVHNDATEGSPRKVAFVLNMTKDWLLHWGGNLVILNEQANKITEAHIPKFNSLVLFDVFTKHSVLPVSCDCKSERFAITGWYRNIY